MKINKPNKSKYIKNPRFCPKCKSRNISSSDGFECEDDYAYKDVFCNNCDYAFREIYTLTNIKEIK